MTSEQAAAYVQAQTACAMAEIAAMHAANYTRDQQDHTHAYDEEAFRDITNRFGLHHNSVLTTFENARG